MSAVEKTGLSPDQIEIAKIFYEFKYKTLMEAATKLMQMSIVFLSVTSLVTAFAVIKNFDPETRDILLICAIIIVFFFCLLAGSIVYGIVTGLNQIRDTFLDMSPEVFARLGMDNYFRRGAAVVAFVSCTAAAGVIVTLTVVLFHF